MEKKKRSPIMVISFAALIGFLVIALLDGTIRPSSVVAAKVGLALGTLLTADLMEVRSVPTGGVPSDAFKPLQRSASHRLILLIQSCNTSLPHLRANPPDALFFQPKLLR